MKNNYIKYFIIILIVFISFMNTSYAEEYKGKITGTEVRIRKGPGTNYATIKELTKDVEYKMVSNTLYPSEGGCSKGWYNLYYTTNASGYVCADYVSVSVMAMDDVVVVTEDEYLRPWTTPKAAIVGGAKYIGKYYIQKGQYTSYLKKFNVNPNGSYSVYNHQYMANLAAPYSEAGSSYKSYLNNDLLKEPLEFTIPIFTNMPAYTVLPGKNADTSCQSEITDQAFEDKLNAEGFPESYKCKLRLLHNSYPNWIFKGMNTNLDFDRSVRAEKAVSSIQGGNIYYELINGNPTKTETGWYLPNYETTAYYLDPRNFLIAERVLMFENLTYNNNATETVVSSILKGTFMDGYSVLDNASYASIFIEAGKTANMNSVYLASLARQESGTKGGRATTGAEFTYQGVTYKGLYNFFNIGAYSSAESPVLAGLVWASGGSEAVVVKSGSTNTETPSNESSLLQNKVATLLNSSIKNNCLVGVKQGLTANALKEALQGYTVDINETDILKTGTNLVVNDGTSAVNLTVVISGDVDGDGQIEATDYVKIKNYIMEKSGSELNVHQGLAADVDNNGEIGATDYVKIKNSIMGR